MKVVIDTNIFIADYHMSKSDFKELFKKLDLTKYTIYIPQLVFDEVVNNYSEQLIEKKGSVKTAINNWNRVTKQGLGQPITDAYIQEQKKEYKDFLNKKLADIHTKILDYPKISHPKVVKRALERKKPFDEKGKYGYRDVLIWESILELAKSKPTESIAFISKNSSDFATKKSKDSANDSKDKLHSDLLDELDDNCSEVHYFSSLEDFVREHITLETVDDVQELTNMINHSEKKQ